MRVMLCLARSVLCMKRTSPAKGSSVFEIVLKLVLDKFKFMFEIV